MDEHRSSRVDRSEEDRGGRRLDEEGIPDLEGPLPEKAATGDPQEGLPLPSDRPASLDWGTTRAEEAGGEPLDLRLSHEVPEVDGDEWADEQLHAGDAVARDPLLQDAGDEIILEPSEEDEDEEAGLLVEETPFGVDVEKDMVADRADDPTAGESAEEAAVHLVEEPPGAVYGSDFSLEPEEEDDERGA